MYDRQPNGALPAATDVLTSNTIMAAQNLDNRDRFLILADIMPYDQVENISNPSANSDLVTRDTSSAILKLFIPEMLNHCRHHVWFPIMMTNCNAGTLTGETGIQRVRFVDE